MSKIVLSNASRDSLTALKNTAQLMAMTQGRLSTGKKVNSALDNPNSFFTAQGLNNRASDLNNLLDDLGQGIQTLKAADQAITSIGKLVDAAKAKANQALQTTSHFDRSKYITEYNNLVEQIEGLAKDASYKGKNLLAGGDNSLTLYFNEDNSNRLTIENVDYTDASGVLGLTKLTEATVGTRNITLNNGAVMTGSSLIASDTNDFDVGNIITVSNASGALGEIEITAEMTVSDFVTEYNRTFDNSRASFLGGVLTIESAEAITISGGTVGGSLDNDPVAGVASSWATEGQINETLTRIKAATDTIRLQASTFGTNMTMLQNREAFIIGFSETLNTGADRLVVADMNEEGANLLALQTRQQLSTTALSLATQAEQGVLRLFG